MRCGCVSLQRREEDSREKTPALHVGRGPVPRQAIGHAKTRGGQAPALRFLRVSLIFRKARACPSPCVWIPSALITLVGQDRQILPRSRSGDLELQVGPMPAGIRPPRGIYTETPLGNTLIKVLTELKKASR